MWIVVATPSSLYYRRRPRSRAPTVTAPWTWRISFQASFEPLKIARNSWRRNFAITRIAHSALRSGFCACTKRLRTNSLIRIPRQIPGKLPTDSQRSLRPGLRDGFRLGWIRHTLHTPLLRRKGGRVVEGSGLENRQGVYAPSWVRIPPLPPPLVLIQGVSARHCFLSPVLPPCRTRHLSC